MIWEAEMGIGSHPLMTAITRTIQQQRREDNSTISEKQSSMRLVVKGFLSPLQVLGIVKVMERTKLP
jgi:hypothetical protein